MSRPLHRGVSGGGGRLSGNSNLWEDSQMKERAEKEDIDRTRTNGSDHAYLSIKSPLRILFPDKLFSKHSLGENGFVSDPFSPGNLRSRHKVTISLLKLSLVVLVILALTGSFWWTLSITSMTRGKIFHGYRRLQEQLYSEFHEIGELSLGSSRMRELDYCSEESENYVPCFNVSENLALGFINGEEYNRHCEGGSKQNCLVLTPVNYKIPLRWPTGKDVIWFANVNITAQEVLSSGSLTKSFGAHLSSNQLLTMCIANYEASGSQVQLTLERGLPAMIGSFTSKQLPYPSLSFDMIHCARCRVNWDAKDGIFLLEVDRLLRPGGFFVWTSPLINFQRSLRIKVNLKQWNAVRSLAENLCWEMLPQQDETAVWKKTMSHHSKKESFDFISRKTSFPSLCSKSQDIESPYYRPLQSCISGAQSRRWNPIEERRKWPSQAMPNSAELQIHGLQSDEVAEDAINWKAAVGNYWSLLSPLIFSDHPKRPGDEDPSPPFNMLRNVLDMNAHLGGFNAALLETGKSVWVMNVVPTRGPNSLPLIVDRGFIGVQHNWCEPFPTYPRTYDLVHAQGLISLQFADHPACQALDLFTEIDRLLRPEGWVILRDSDHLIEFARSLTTHMKWEARVVEIESTSDEKLLICQKPFSKR
ncbi:hypothetical protein F511_11910 [Dorcoceras hygrometricum]|uniref:Methyltransferase n=1 Tax=Dorcoceras hygrometricum TaxID=472368 RepID=A0A2Z7B494_9LAMI|nr:hypothetical protein F511_11910 [Dorcoceras hygrometricum]